MEEGTLLIDGGSQLLLRLAITTGIGFLIGLEREYAKSVQDKEEHFAGVRTYTLFALFGFVAALLADEQGPWLFAVALAGFVAFTITAYAFTARAGSYGGTTELSGILTFLLGAMVFHGHVLLSAFVAVAVLLLLSFKLPLHRFINKLTIEEIRAFIRFVIISALVLPFLPKEKLGPMGVWDPQDIWTMVILVTGISLVGYLLAKFLGGRGTLLAGALGGLISSTATTLSLSRRSKEKEGAATTQALGIVAACTVMFPRVLLVVAVVNMQLAARLWPWLMLATASAAAVTWWMHRKGKSRSEPDLQLQDSLNLGVALQFAVIYALVIWLVAWANARYGAEGIYLASAISGLTDMDAIALSMARSGPADEGSSLAVTAILIAALSNTIAKALIVAIAGSTALKKEVAPGFGAMALALLIGILVRLIA